MATAALTNTPTSIADGESVTGWSGESFDLEPDIKVAGSNSVACAQTTNGDNDAIFTKASGSWDFSSGEHLRLWFNSSAAPTYADILANGGIQIGLSDGTNTDWFYVGGSDVYGGGWAQIVLYTLNTPDVDNSANLAAITSITFRMFTTSKPRNVPANLWLDAWSFGDGFTVTGGTSGDPIDWSHIAAIDKTNAYNIVSNVDDVIFLAGEVTIGDGISTAYFEPTNQIAVYKDLPVNSTLYQLNFYDDASNLTNITISGGAWTAAGTQEFLLDASVVCNAFSMSGVQVSRASNNSSFHAGASVTANVFNDCGMLDPDTATFETNTISNSFASGAGTGALYLPLVNNVNNITFNGNDRDVLIDQSGTYSGISLTHGANNFDIDYNNASAGTFNVPSTGDTAAVTNTGAGTLTIVAGLVTLTIKGWISGSQLVIYDDDSADPQELGTQLQRNNNITADETYVYSGSKAGDDIVIVMIPPTDAYKIIQDTITLGANSADYALKPIQETN